MKITLVEPKFLKDSISIISDLVTETRFRITKDLVEIVAMDPANVAMVIFRMPSNTFAEYEVKEDMILSINLNDFKSVLRRAKPNDVLTLEVAESKLKITMKEKSTRTFFLPLIDLEDKPQRVPNLEAAAIVEMPSSSLTETIEDMDIVSESITFTAEKDKFVVSAAGDLKKAEVVTSASNEVKIRIQKPKDGEKETLQRSKYSIEYLKKMMQGSKLASNVTIKFSKDFPLTLDYKEPDKVQLSFILAPRVDND